MNYSTKAEVLAAVDRINYLGRNTNTNIRTNGQTNRQYRRVKPPLPGSEHEHDGWTTTTMTMINVAMKMLTVSK